MKPPPSSRWPSLFVAGLEILLRVANVPAYTMPLPSEIGAALFGNFGLFAPHLVVTLQVLAIGYAIGAIIGIVLAGLITQFPFAEKIIIMADRLAASTNTYHSYSLEEALDGIAAAGFTSVELTSVPGWTEHVRRDADDAEIQRVKDLLAQYGLTAVSLSGHSDLVSDEGVAEFRKALDLARKLGITKITTSTGGHDDTSERQSRGAARGVPGAHRPARRRSGRRTASTSAWRPTAVCWPPARSPRR